MSDDDRWIVIPRWEEFQHPDAARSGVPPWLKTYTKLLSDDDYLSLSPHQRAVLHGLWLEYARARRQLAVNTASLSRRIGIRVSMTQLNALNHAGFLEFSASRPASNHASRFASLEGDKKEKDPISHAERGTQDLHCNVCGEPVEAWKQCPNCHASPRAAGTNSRALGTRAVETGQAARRAALHAQVDDLAASWNGGTSEDFADALDAIERECGAKLDFLDREEVMDRALLGRQDDEIF